jgi:hypothetical protein
MFENCTWQLDDMKISFIGFVFLYYFPNLVWVVHAHFMPRRSGSQTRFGKTGVDASKMRT